MLHRRRFVSSLSTTIVVVLLVLILQSTALSAISEVIEHLDEQTVRKTVIPKARQLLEVNDTVHVSSFFTFLSFTTLFHLFGQIVNLYFLSFINKQDYNILFALSLSPDSALDFLLHFSGSTQSA